MSVIYLGKKDGTQSKHSEDELQTMRASGTLDPSWLYWHAGMPEWRPVSTWIAENPPPIRSFLEPGEDEITEEDEKILTKPSRLALRKDPVLISQILQSLLVLVGVVNVMELFAAFWEFRILRLPSNMQFAPSAAYILSTFAIAISSLIVTIPTIIFFCIWTYRIKANVWEFSSGLKISPGWAVGWYFVPFLNMLRPWQSMREAWLATENPNNWKPQAPTQLVDWWWGVWVSCGVLGFLGQQFVSQATFSRQRGEDAQQLLFYANYTHMVSALAGVAVCVLAFLVVRNLTRMQVVLVQTQVEPSQNMATLPRS